MPGFRHYLAIQIVLPEDYLRSLPFAADLRALQRAGYDGVELNLDPEVEDPLRLRGFLADFGLTLSMLATGRSARMRGLSLAAAEEARRREAVRWTREALAFSAAIGGGAGVIAGYLKGAMGKDTPLHRLQLRNSVAELGPAAQRLETPLLVEAVNRFESPLGHTLAEVAELLGEPANPFLWILPDTWHMGIEEAYPEAALVRFKGRYGLVHLSDSNRLFPGEGGRGFGRILAVLEALGYDGRLAVEGNLQHGLAEDATRAAEFLRPLLRTDQKI